MRRTLLAVLMISFMAGIVLYAQEGFVRVPEPEAKKAIATRVEPEYPAMAKQMRVAGRVQVDAYIDTDGSIQKVQPLNGNMLLSSAAANAVKRWKFSPIMANGKPCKAVTTLTFDFKL